MSARFVSKFALATAAASGLIAFGIGAAIPSGTASAEPLGCVDSVALTALGLTIEPESYSSCESQRDSCLDMNSKEDVWGNPYTPADAYHECMDAYWYCRNGQG